MSENQALPKLHMTESEICAAYRQAKNKNEQVKILADRNLVSANVIVGVLSANGYITGLPGNKTAQAEAAKVEAKAADPKAPAEPFRKYQLIEMADKGMTITEAAEALKQPYKTVYNAAARYGIRFAGQRKSAPSTAIEKAEKVAKKTTCKKNTTPAPETQAPKAAIAPETVSACADPSGLPPVNWVATLQLMLTSVIHELLGIDAEPLECGAMPDMAVVIAEYAGCRYRLELSEEENK
ncbi:MAG: helix-turn-helix domain-containing protein [Candidatus Fimivivens sp.]|nr:helix-turn-helix domain-containing protein [Candidatus Fimivivens sp.]